MTREFSPATYSKIIQRVKAFALATIGIVGIAFIALVIAEYLTGGDL